MPLKMSRVLVLYGLGALSRKLRVVPQKKKVITLEIRAAIMAVKTRAAGAS